MIGAKRPADAPASLSGAAASADKEAAKTYYKSWKPGQKSYDFKHYSGYDVVDALRKMFHSKCAYCERQIEKGSREVEHYRPKGRVEDPDHSGYWWLAHSWTNLLPTCGPCNKGLHQHIVTLDMTEEDVEKLQATEPKRLMGKAHNFPVGAPRLAPSSEDHLAEQPRLIDPSRANPDDYLTWNDKSHFSIVTARIKAGQASIEGDETIRCLALNRSGLVVARTEALNILRGQRTRVLEDLEEIKPLSQDEQTRAIKLILRTVDDMKVHCDPKKQFAAMATAFVVSFREELHDWLKVHAPQFLDQQVESFAPAL